MIINLITKQSKFNLFTLLCLLAFSITAQAQETNPSNSTPVYKISQGETLQDFPADAHNLEQTIWVLTSPDGKTLNSQGAALFTYKFDQVGTYTIAFTRIPQPKHEHDGHTCDHYHMPASISVQVSAEKIAYLCETLKTSKPLVGGQSTEGITLSITVNITGNNVKIPETIVSAGVETNIVGKLDPSQKIVQAGTHTLVYHLSGKGLKGTYIQFDFEDSNQYFTPCPFTTQL